MKQRIQSLATHSLSLSRKPTSNVAQIVARQASTVTHDDHHHHESHEDGPHTPETFFNSFWRNTVIVSIVGYGLYSVAPTPVLADGQDSKLTAWIRRTLTPVGVWQKRNENHLALSKTAADAKWLTGSAEKPIMHRYRYYGGFEDASPHNVPVGDLSANSAGLLIKSDIRTKLA